MQVVNCFNFAGLQPIKQISPTQKIVVKALLLNKKRCGTFLDHQNHRLRKLGITRSLGKQISDDDGPPMSPFQQVGPALDAETLQELEQDHPRRTLLVAFTCNKCDGRTERLVNPVAWKKGLVFCQCGTCNVWHKLADAANLIEEIRFVDEP